MPRKGSDSETVYRLWYMLSKIPRAPRKVDTARLERLLEAEAIAVTRRTIQRDLEALASHFPDLECDRRSKPYGWCWRDRTPMLDVPPMGLQSAVTFELVRAYLQDTLPRATARALEPYYKRAREVLPLSRGRFPLAPALLALCTEDEQRERSVASALSAAPPEPGEPITLDDPFEVRRDPSRQSLRDEVPDVLLARLPALSATLLAHATILSLDRPPLKVDLENLAASLAIEPQALIWLIERAGLDVGFEPPDLDEDLLGRIGCEEALRIVNGSSNGRIRERAAVHALSAAGSEWRAACDRVGTITTGAVDALAAVIERGESMALHRFAKLPHELMLDAETARRWAERGLELLACYDGTVAFLWDDALHDLQDLPCWTRSDGPIRALFGAVLERALSEPFDAETDVWSTLVALTGIVTSVVDLGDRERHLAKQAVTMCLAHPQEASTYPEVRLMLLELLALGVDTRAALQKVLARAQTCRTACHAERHRAVHRATLAFTRSEHWVHYAEEAEAAEQEHDADP